MQIGDRHWRGAPIFMDARWCVSRGYSYWYDMVWYRYDMVPKQLSCPERVCCSGLVWNPTGGGLIVQDKVSLFLSVRI